MSSETLWFGASDAGVFVFDPSIQPTAVEQIVLFDVERKALARYEKAQAKPKLRTLQDSAKIDLAREKYEKWRYFYSSTIPAILSGPPLDFPLSPLEERHKQFLKLREKPFLGTRERSTHLPRRSPHCWSCHSELDSSINLECCACGWILCSCGACGCGRNEIREVRGIKGFKNADDDDDVPF